MHVWWWLEGRGGAAISLPFAQTAYGGRVRGKLSVGKGNSERKKIEPDKMGEGEWGGGGMKEGEKGREAQPGNINMELIHIGWC